MSKEEKKISKNKASVTDESLRTRDKAKEDPNGILLVPQPTNDPEDPLNWPSWRKQAVLVQVSLISFLSLFSASLIVSNEALQRCVVQLTLKQGSHLRTFRKVPA